ncbi:hypothetical protein HJG60_008140 [Phyllostomus discolor]|uniref:Uncharacterized protein n=1 Tax=Phyllostomus discolor TaxID=89673 RepID=A0A833Z6H4_9CHIR|nr:hypothetical protein HJG60_008140 [Phyllostomus discolor]
MLALTTPSGWRTRDFLRCLLDVWPWKWIFPPPHWKLLCVSRPHSPRPGLKQPAHSVDEHTSATLIAADRHCVDASLFQKECLSTSRDFHRVCFLFFSCVDTIPDGNGRCSPVHETSKHCS